MAKIAIVGINYVPELTGIAVYTTGMAEYLAERGFAVTVYAGFPYYPLWSKATKDSKRCYRKEQINSVTVRRSFLYVPKRLTAAKRILHELTFVISASANYLLGPKADCTIIVSPPLLLGIPIALIAKLKRSKTVFHVQDLQPDAAIDLGMLKKGLLTDALFHIERLTYRLVDRVSTLSQGMLNKIAGKKVDPDKLFIFRNWANDDQIVPMTKSTSYRRDMGYEDKFIVMYSGNMGVKQGLGVLLEAASFLRDVNDIVFLIVGDGGEKQNLQRHADELKLTKVTFLPVQPYGKLAELLASADVAIVPQKKGVNDIVLPSKLANIMASRRPIIVAAPMDSELGRIVLESKSGLRVEPGEPARMAEAIKRLYEHPHECEEMGRNARRYMEKHFARHAILDEFSDQVQMLLKK